MVLGGLIAFCLLLLLLLLSCAENSEEESDGGGNTFLGDRLPHELEFDPDPRSGIALGGEDAAAEGLQHDDDEEDEEDDEDDDDDDAPRIRVCLGFRV